MKILKLTILLTALLCIFSNCKFVQSSRIIDGTVTLKFNGFSLENNNSFIQNYSRGLPPPPIQITAYSEDMEWIAWAPVTLQANNNEHSNEKYQWTLNIPEDKLPGYIYFWITYWRQDVAFGLAGVLTDKFWIENEKKVVDIGIINYNVIQLYGNIPIEYGGNRMNLTLFPQGNASYLPTDSTNIDFNGDWSIKIDKRNLETQIEFTVNFGEGNSLILNPYTFIETDTGIEVLFTNYQSGLTF